MKNLITLAVLFSFSFGWSELFSQCADPLNIYSFSYGGKNYEVVKEMKTWINASACAVERGGYLVEINDAGEQTAVYNAISSAGISPTYTSISNGGGIAYVWIGATDQSGEGIWLWDGNNDNQGANFWTGQGANGQGNGASVGGLFQNWGGKSTGTPKEPDNYGSGQHHAAVGLAGWPKNTTNLGIAGEWNDIIGSSLLYFVIEKNTNVGVNDRNNKSDLKVFPNPCQDKLIIDSQYLTNGGSYTIYDFTGKLITRDTFKNNNIIDVRGLPKGVYILKPEGNVTTFIKFLKE